MTSSMTEKKMSKEKKDNRKGAVTVSIFFMVALVIVMIYILFPGSSEIVETENEDRPNINILVRNGCGVSGLAQRVSQALLYNGITVIDWENISNTQCEYEETMLVVRQEGEEIEKKLNYLKSKTGLKNITRAVKDNAKAEFELILGKDYMLYF